MDPTHICSNNTPQKMVISSLQTGLRYRITWSCHGCRSTYRSGTTSCAKVDCKLVYGHSYRQVEEIFLRRVEEMLLLCEDWVQQEDEFPESISGLMLTETLLAPHGRKLSVMQLGA